MRELLSNRGASLVFGLVGATLMVGCSPATGIDRNSLDTHQQTNMKQTTPSTQEIPGLALGSNAWAKTDLDRAAPAKFETATFALG